jgi:hypothetical protein
MDAHFTSKADIEGTQTDVCFVPITDIDRAAITTGRRRKFKGGRLGYGSPAKKTNTPWSNYLDIAALAASIFAFTASRLKLAPFCIGGNSTAVIASFSTCC